LRGVEDRVRRVALREDLLVLAKRLEGPAAVHPAEKIAHIELLLLRLSHDFPAPASIERVFILPNARPEFHVVCRGNKGFSPIHRHG
jgi:hypothetical protein